MKFVVLTIVCLLFPTILAISRSQTEQQNLQTLKLIKCPSKSKPGTSLTCPHENGICCSEADYCCPQGYTCGTAQGFDHKCHRAVPSAAASIGVSASMQAVLQSAAQIAAPSVSNMESSSVSPTESSAVAPQMGTNAEIPNIGSADVPLPPPEENEANKPAIIVMKNVNALYKGPPKNGIVTPVLAKSESSHESSHEASQHELSVLEPSHESSHEASHEASRESSAESSQSASKSSEQSSEQSRSESSQSAAQLNPK